MTRFLLLLLVALQLFVSCKSEAQSDAVASPVIAPSVLLGGIPVYSKFDDFEYWLHFDNDTTYVVNFWATWCKPCVEELPWFEQLHEQFQDQKVKVVLVSLDFKKDLEKKLLPFVQSRKLKSTVLALTDSGYQNWIDKVSPAWGGAIPVTLVYNARKRAFKDDQFSDYEELERMLKDLGR
ncbi:MAG: redoxin domain-containing protein [Saprospiraceae bacterium]|nr:redoxin domain-containing protein [Saprospiraceae bacterium]MDZ4706037.1 redoxin domain-containing protein [Saprospiraceae bacterium]